MVFSERLLTRSKLKQWGTADNDACVLCDNGTEDFNHLFFACSKYICREMTRTNDRCRTGLEWQQEKVRMIRDAAGSSFQAKWCCLALSTTVY